MVEAEESISNDVIEYSAGEPRLFYFGSLGGSLIIVAVGFFLSTLIYAVPVIIAFAFAQNRGTVNKFARLFDTQPTAKKSKKNNNRRRKFEENDDEKYNSKFSFSILQISY